MTSTYVIDANVILRYLLQDHAEHFERASSFMVKLRAGDVMAYIPEGVLVECVYVLLKVYGVPREETADKLSGVLSFRGVVDENRKILLNSLRSFAEKNVDIVDAIVHTTAAERHWEPFSSDKDIEKLSD